MTAATTPVDRRSLALGLAVLRISLGLFLLTWAVEKFVIPQTTVGIWGGFYWGIEIGASMPYIIGTMEVVLSLAITVGFMRRWSYGLGLLLHTGSVLATWKQLMDPWGVWLFERPQHLFLAGVPLWAGFFTIYILREVDTWTVDGRRQRLGA